MQLHVFTIFLYSISDALVLIAVKNKASMYNKKNNFLSSPNQSINCAYLIKSIYNNIVHKSETFWDHLKSDNLQYNTLGCWVGGTIASLTKHLMFQVLFFFIISCKILCKNPFNSIFFYYFTKIKSSECPKSKPATHCFIFNLSK